MAYIGRQQSSGAFAKIDDISSQFNNSKTVLDYGTITPSPKDNLSIRLSTIYHDLLLIIVN